MKNLTPIASTIAQIGAQRNHLSNLIVGEKSEQISDQYEQIIKRAKLRLDIKFLTVKETAAKCSKGVSTIWLEVKNGDFIKPVNCSTRSVRWVSSEVDAILEARILMARTGIPLDMKLFVKLLSSPNSGAQNQV